MRRSIALVALLAVIGCLAGCGLKRAPQSVFPGSQDYETRIATFKITPTQAYKIALEAAQTDNKLQFLSKLPTVVYKRSYVFSMPQASGASLHGYHVNGDTGDVTFFSKNQNVYNTR